MLRNLLGNASEMSFRGEAGLSKRVFPNEPNFPPKFNKINIVVATKRTDKPNPPNTIPGRRLLPPQENTR